MRVVVFNLRDSSKSFGLRIQGWFTPATCAGPTRLDWQSPKLLGSPAMCDLHCVRSTLAVGRVFVGKISKNKTELMRETGLRNILIYHRQVAKTLTVLSGGCWRKRSFWSWRQRSLQAT